MTAVATKSPLARTLQWSTATPVDWEAVVGAAIAMAVPVLLAVIHGEASQGLTAAAGVLLAGGSVGRSGGPPPLRALTISLAPVVAGTAAVLAVAGHGWLTDAAVAVLAILAALVSGYSRGVAAMTTRFTILLIIAVAMLDRPTAHGTAVPGDIGHGGAALLILGGAVWASLVHRVLDAIARRPGRAPAVPHPAAALRKRWLRSLRRIESWQYALRLALGLTVAGVLNHRWPDHHLYWTALTVLLVTERQVEPFPVKAIQRAVGTAIGVVAAELLPALPGWALVGGIGTLAALRPLLQVRNYLAYAAAMTPLVVVLLDGGRPADPRVLVDRLVATLAGAALVIAGNRLAALLLPPA